MIVSISKDNSRAASGRGHDVLVGGFARHFDDQCGNVRSLVVGNYVADPKSGLLVSHDMSLKSVRNQRLADAAADEMAHDVADEGLHMDVYRDGEKVDTVSVTGPIPPSLKKG